MLPSRASDAGPDTRPSQHERPPTWDDYALVAEEELHAVQKLYRDNPALERKLRLECIDRAQTALDEARTLLVGVQVAGQCEARQMAIYAAERVWR